MSAYQRCGKEICPQAADVSSSAAAAAAAAAAAIPRTPVVALRRSWYSLTFDDDTDNESSAEVIVVARGGSTMPTGCQATATPAVSDNCSDASTDAGADDLEERELVDDLDEEGRDVYVHIVQSRPIFSKLSRQQRIEQLRRVVDEFCSLDFHAVDASSQGGLVLRMLTILKSLSESTVFYAESGRSEEQRMLLLGFGTSVEEAIHEATRRAETLCEGRMFRAAFDTLRLLAPRLSGGQKLQANPMSTEEVEAMALRRLQKKQRQRQDRREQRATDRAERSTNRRATARTI